MTGMLKKYSPQLFGKVAVLMGGDSAERTISLESGNAVLQALQNENIDVYEFDTKFRSVTELVEEQFDRVFIALHGRGGEDGVTQGALETLNIPYTGSGVLGSALGMDKLRSKQVWLNIGLPTPDFVMLNDDFDVDDVIERLGLPMMVKPAHEGSSIGISKVKTKEELLPAYKNAKALDDSVIAERFIEGGEYTVPLLDDLILPMIQLKTSREFYDYEAKYESDDTQYICPCGLDRDLEQKIGSIASKAFSSLDCSGWGRVDILLDEKLNPWLIEVNTVPGMTSHSLVPMGAKHYGISFNELVLRILSSTLSVEQLR